MAQQILHAKGGEGGSMNDLHNESAPCVVLNIYIAKCTIMVYTFHKNYSFEQSQNQIFSVLKDLQIANAVT